MTCAHPVLLFLILLALASLTQTATAERFPTTRALRVETSATSKRRTASRVTTLFKVKQARLAARP
jgi:hypothetical protein